MGVAAALAILSTCAEAQVMVSTTSQQFGPSSDGSVGWNPIEMTSYQTTSGYGPGVFLVVGCFGSVSLWNNSSGTPAGTYDTIRMSAPLSLGQDVKNDATWLGYDPDDAGPLPFTSTFQVGSGVYIASGSLTSFGLTSGTTFYLGFSFTKTASPTDSYFGYAQINETFVPDVGTTMELQGFAWNQTPNASLTVAPVSSVPEPGVTALCMGLASALLVGVRRKWSALRSLIG
jgi:hypothetical protein